MSRNPGRTRWNCALILACAAVPMPLAAVGNVVYTWRGGSASNDWELGGNWVNSVPPASDAVNTDIVFTVISFPFPNESNPISVHSLTFNSPAEYVQGGVGTLSLGAGGITDSSAVTQTVDNPVTLLSAQTWMISNATGTLDMVGAVSAGVALTVNAQGNNALAGAFTGNLAFIKAGAGTLAMTGSLISSGITVTSGALAFPTGETCSPFSLNIDAGTAVNASGGTLNITDTTEVGNTAGSAALLNLSSGSLHQNEIDLGAATSGTGTFIQSGGTNTASAVEVGEANNSDGNYTLNGGTLSATAINVGNPGTGLFVQNGGLNTGGQVYLDNGAYALNGGTLRTQFVTSLLLGGVFDFNGGTLQAAGNFNLLSGLSAVDVQFGGAIIDTNGFNDAILQPLLHDTTAGAPALDGGLIKQGTGTLTLKMDNTFTGDTAVQAGTLDLDSSGALQDSTLHLSSGGGTLTFDSAVTSDAFTLGGLSGGGNLSLKNDAVSVGNNNTSTSFSGALSGSGSGSLIKIGTGTLTLNGSNSYSGPTTINAGKLIVGNGGSLINSLISVGPGGTFNISGGNVNAGSATFVQAGTAASTTAATINLSSGTLVDGETDVANAAGSTASFVQTGGTHTINGELAIGVNSGGSGSYSLSGNSTLTAVMIAVGINGSGVFTQNGGLVAAGNAVALGFNPGSVGTYDLNGGILNASQVVGQTSLEATGTLNFNGGTLQVAPGGGFVSGLSNVQVQAGGAFIDSNNSIINIDISLNHDATPGAPAMDGGLTKLGGGTLMLTLGDTFTGNTTIQAGTLQLNSAAALLDSTAALSSTGGALVFDEIVSPAIFTLGGLSGNGNLALQNNASPPGAVTLAVGNNKASTLYSGALSGPGALTKIGTGTLTLTGVSTYTGATTASAGALTIGTGGSLSNSMINVAPGAVFNISGGNVNTGSGTSVEVGTSAGAAATVNLSSGTLTDSDVDVASAAGSSANFVQSGGTHTVNDGIFLGVGSASAGTYSLSGGTLAANQTGVGSFGSGVFTQSGGLHKTGILVVGFTGSPSAIYNLNGGMLSTPLVTSDGGTSTFNFNGGTLQDRFNEGGFFNGLTAAVVQSGGAIIDSNGLDAVVAQSLIHDPATGAPAIDGGLTKIGLGTLALESSNTYTGPTTVMAGNLKIDAAGGLSGGPVTIGVGTTAASVTISNGVGQLTVSGLTLGGNGVLDLGNNKLRINYGSPAADPVKAIAADLASGNDGGEWEGVGINSSAAAVNATKFALGYLDGNSPGDAAEDTVAPNQIVIKYTLAGDAFLENTVGFDDLVVVAQNFGFTGKDWAGGDFNYDPSGSVGFQDLVFVAQNFGLASGVNDGDSGGVISPAWQTVGATDAVPEPVAMLGVAGGMMVMGRRRKR